MSLHVLACYFLCRRSPPDTRTSRVFGLQRSPRVLCSNRVKGDNERREFSSQRPISSSLARWRASTTPFRFRLPGQLERARAILQKRSGGLGKLCVVMDYVGFSLRNAPSMKISMATLNIVQNHYPETLGQAFFVSPPFVFKGFWKVGGRRECTTAGRGVQTTRALF